METLELRIDALAAGGDGIGRDERGRAVFVPFTAPGDRVRVRIVEARRRFARGKVETLLEPGPARVDPACAVFGTCGGCAWQHVDYAAQLEAKARIVADAFERIGSLRTPGPVRIAPSPQPYGYRTRARVVVSGGRVGFRRRRSSALCATSHCPVLAPELQESLAALGRDPPREDGEWELSLGPDAVRAHPLAAPGGAPLALEVEGGRLALSPGVFAQANASLHRALERAVLEAAGEGAACLELYAGAGFFSLGLARRFEQLVAVEASAAAARDLAANLRAAGCGHARALEDSVERALARGAALRPPPDVVVLDPPRAGLPRDAAETLARLPARRVVYVSCDPATLARDAALFADRGWDLRALSGFDLFPQTPHVELVAALGRAGDGLPGRG